MRLSERKSRWQSWVNLILGIILFLSPWYSVTWSHANSSWNAWICGVLIAVVAIGARFDDFPATISWMNIAIGAWLFISPWVVGFASAASVLAWSVWIIGALVFILALWAELGYRNPPAKATV
jgi:predicted ferric reductase